MSWPSNLVSNLPDIIKTQSDAYVKTFVTLLRIRLLLWISSQIFFVHLRWTNTVI